MNGTSSGSDLQARLQKRGAGAATNRGGGSEPAQRALRELKEHRQARARYHRERYKNLDQSVERGGTQSVGAPDRGRPVDLSWHLRRELGSDAVVCQPHPEPPREAGRIDAPDRAGADTARSTSGADVGRVAPRGGGRGKVRSAPQGTPLDNGWPYKVQGQSAVPLWSE